MAMWRTPLLQTATNAAAVIVAAEIGSGELKPDLVGERFAELRDEFFGPLDERASLDDEARQAEFGGSKKSTSSKSRSSRTRKTAGGRGTRSKSKTGTGFPGDLDDALAMELNFGAFEGETLEALLGIDADKADEDYAYGDGERDGRDYLSWLASDRNKNRYAREAAQLVCEDANIDFEE